MKIAEYDDEVGLVEVKFVVTAKVILSYTDEDGLEEGASIEDIIDIARDDLKRVLIEETPEWMHVTFVDEPYYYGHEALKGKA